MRKVIAIALVLAAATDADALGRRNRVTYKSQSCYDETPAGFSYSASESCRAGACKVESGLVVSGTFPAATPNDGSDALDEVNALRARRGLPPYLRDPGLTAGARAAAAARAARNLFGHFTGGAGDFAFLPPGVHADAAGCAAYPASYGWLSCGVYDRATYAGAAWVMGSDNKRYMHLFIRR